MLSYHLEADIICSYLAWNVTMFLQEMPGILKILRSWVWLQILYNQLYNRYMILFHSDTATFSYPTIGVAMANEITGPYEWVRVFHPDGLNSFDMGVFQEDDGTAYLVRSVNNEFVGISQLTPDYTETMGITSSAPRVQSPIS
jgi:hypothetical protein